MAKYSKYRVVPKEKLDAISKVIQEKAGVSGGLTLDGMQETANGLYPTSTIVGLIKRNITEIEIPSGTTSIGASAFRSCNSLKEVTLPEGITSFGEYAFALCGALKKIDVPYGVKSLGFAAFQSSGKLAEVTLPNTLTYIDQFVFHSTAIAEITLPNSITSMHRQAFDACSKLKTLYLDWAEGEISGAPWGATNAEKVYLRSTTEGLVFTLNTTEGTGYIVTGFETPEGYDPVEGTDVYIPRKYNGSSVVGIAPNAFDRSYNTILAINSIRLPNTLTSIGDFAFSDQSFSSITLPGSITDMGINALAYIYDLTDVYVPWAEGKVANAPWGAEGATIHYNHTT